MFPVEVYTCNDIVTIATSAAGQGIFLVWFSPFSTPKFTSLGPSIVIFRDRPCTCLWIKLANWHDVQSISSRFHSVYASIPSNLLPELWVCRSPVTISSICELVFFYRFRANVLTELPYKWKRNSIPDGTYNSVGKLHAK